MHVELKNAEVEFGNTKPNSNGVWRTEIKVKIDTDPELLRQLVMIAQSPGMTDVIVTTPQEAMALGEGETEADTTDETEEAPIDLTMIDIRKDDDEANEEPFSCTLNEQSFVGKDSKTVICRLLAGLNLVKRIKGGHLKEGNYDNVDVIALIRNLEKQDVPGMDMIINILREGSFEPAVKV